MNARRQSPGRENELSDWTGFLERGNRVEGTLEAPGTFRLDGTLKGRIVSGQLLVLGETAEVEGEIDGERVMIYGRFRGTVRASATVEIHSEAVVSGDIYTPCLLLEPGGRFDGHCYLNPAGAATDPLHVPIRAYASSGTEGDQVEPGSQVIRGRMP
jgi:cytoskeletal protein CcmA (bactofilin family)